jgi:hypothetical protein
MPFPSKKTPELTDEVLRRIAMGLTLASCGRELGFHPTVWSDWVKADEALALAYQRARDIGADALAEEALALIDEEPERIVTTEEGVNGGNTRTTSRIDSAAVAWQRNRVETRLKLLACWNPKKYGNKTTLQGDKDAPLETKTTVELAKGTAAELAKTMRAVAQAKDDAKDIL